MGVERLGVRTRLRSVEGSFFSAVFDFFEFSGASSKFNRRLRERFDRALHVSCDTFVASGASVEELSGDAGGDGGS